MQHEKVTTHVATMLNRKVNMFKQLALGLAIGACATVAYAQTDIQAAPNASAYMQDGRGIVMRSAFGLCWRSGYWTPSEGIAGCDGELVAPIVKPTAPAVVAPTQVVAAPVAPAAPKRCDSALTLASDQTFAFNKAVLTEAAKKHIDSEVPGKLSACNKVEIVMITGHTDRLGPQQYNQKLSDKRAEAVAAYLRSQGVSAQIDTLGVGKTQSVKACDDSLKRSKLVECLAPNRRVVIEIRGVSQ
jgi:OmpA-OmpF porin, OOP family